MTRRKISIEILRDLFAIAVLLAVFVVVLIYLVGYWQQGVWFNPAGLVPLIWGHGAGQTTSRVNQAITPWFSFAKGQLAAAPAADRATLLCHQACCCAALAMRI